MKQSFVICIACAAIVGVPVATLASDQATEHLRYRHLVVRHQTTAPAFPFGLFSWFGKPYPPGQGDVNGLSRNPNDCNMGCIGGIAGH